MAVGKERIAELAEAIAAAVMAADPERANSIYTAMSREEKEALTTQQEVDALLRLVDERMAQMSQLADALVAAQRAATAELLATEELPETNEIDGLIDPISEPECKVLIRELVSRLGEFEDRAPAQFEAILTALDDASSSLPGNDGPFMFRTIGDLSRVVELSAQLALHNAILGHVPELSEEDREAKEGKLYELACAAEGLAAERDPTQRLQAVALWGGKGLKLGRKKHAAVLPLDYPVESDTECRTLCGRGSTTTLMFWDQLHLVDCEGCRNALMLGGFLRPKPE